ncbi:hypothetical protein STEG23_032917 [Scotinomys teguina]
MCSNSSDDDDDDDDKGKQRNHTSERERHYFRSHLHCLGPGSSAWVRRARSQAKGLILSKGLTQLRVCQVDKPRWVITDYPLITNQNKPIFLSCFLLFGHSSEKDRHDNDDEEESRTIFMNQRDDSHPDSGLLPPAWEKDLRLCVTTTGLEAKVGGRQEATTEVQRGDMYCFNSAWLRLSDESGSRKTVVSTAQRYSQQPQHTGDFCGGASERKAVGRAVSTHEIVPPKI